jgi:hypothetical protein
MRTCSFLWIICLLFCARPCFDSVKIEKTVWNGMVTILQCKGFNRPGYRISMTRCYLSANGKKDTVRQAADQKVKLSSATVHAIKQKMQGLTDREKEITVPASESRTDVEPVNKTQPRQGNLLENETPKELLPP